jgi:hypothetical protein
MLLPLLAFPPGWLLLEQNLVSFCLSSHKESSCFIASTFSLFCHILYLHLSTPPLFSYTDPVFALWDKEGSSYWEIYILNCCVSCDRVLLHICNIFLWILDIVFITLDLIVPKICMKLQFFSLLRGKVGLLFYHVFVCETPSNFWSGANISS